MPPIALAVQTVGGVPEPGNLVAFARIALGFLLVGTGLGSLALAVANRRVGGRALLAFGSLTLLYGASFVVAAPALAPLMGASQRTLLFAAAFIYYVLPIPGLMYAEQVRGPGWHGILRRLWQITIPCALGFIAFDVITGEPFASIKAYGFLVIGSMSVLLLNLLRSRQRTDRVESVARRFGTGTLLLSVIHDNLVSFGVLPWRVSLQVVGATAFLLSMGFATLRRLLADQRELAAVERELAMATNIQAGILPREVPAMAALDIAVRYVPSRFVAGDVYGFLKVDRHKVGVLIADVTGHGVPAALIASMVTAVFSAQMDHASDTGRVLSALNRALVGRFDGLFVTAAYVFLDSEQQRLRYSLAGHPHPYLRRRTVAQTLQLSEGGIMLGVLPDVHYPTCECPFEAGDRLLLYTDGVSDASRTDDEWFGDHELPAFLERGDLRAEACAADLLASLDRWTGRDIAPRSFDDDLTVIVVDATTITG